MLVAIALALFTLCTASAQDLEQFHVEVTASLWIRDTSGTIQSGLTPIDLERDLGIESKRPQFFGRLVLKPARRHRIIVEGAPYRLSGEQDAVREFTFAGRQYRFQEHIVSSAEINYVSGTYQFDVVSRERGHFGLQAGIGYVDVTGTVTGRLSGFTGSEQQSFPIPLAGAGFRAAPLPSSRVLNVSGEIKGISLGDYGHYLQATAAAGVNLGRHITLEAGYRVVDADVHRRDGTRGFAPQFTGPILSVQFRD